jgi:hypothetical protein
MKRLAALIASALLTAAVFASSTTTEQPTVYMILLPDDTIEKGKVWPKTEDECLTRARALSGSCSIRRKFVTTTTCADEKAPKLYLAKEKSAEDGKDYWVLPGSGWTDDGAYTEVANLYVHNATWPAGYPNCWVRGEAHRDDWRLNSKDEPGKAFMEIRTPDMPPGDLVAEEPNSVEPFPLSAEDQRDWDARQVAEAAACAAGDVKQCPPGPPSLNTPCGRQFCGVGAGG